MLLPWTAAGLAWVTISQSYWGAQIETIQKQTRVSNSTTIAEPPHLRLGYLWNEPESVDSAEGLGGGLTYALDPLLCDRLIDRMSETPFIFTFVTCDTIYAAVHRAFNVWSDNSAKIGFTDVTAECAKIGDLSANCHLAEIWITVYDTANGQAVSDNSQAASASRHRQLTQALQQAPSGLDPNMLLALDQVALSEAQTGGPRTAALAQNFPAYSSAFRMTNAVQPPAPMVTTKRATMSFNPQLCWYIDSYFCAGLHRYKKIGSMSPDATLVLFRACLYALWGITLLCCLYHFHRLIQGALRVQREHQHQPTGKMAGEMLYAALGALAKQSACGWAIRGLLLVAPLTVYHDVLAPCWSCYDVRNSPARTQSWGSLPAP